MGVQCRGYLLVQRIIEQIYLNLYLNILVGLCSFISDQTGSISAMNTLNCTIKTLLLAKGRSNIRLNRVATLEKLHFHILGPTRKFKDRVILLPFSC